MNTADEMRQLADTLTRLAGADIWYDFDWWREYMEPEEAALGIKAVDEAQAAMTRAAELLRHLADPTRQLTPTEHTILRGMIP